MADQPSIFSNEQPTPAPQAAPQAATTQPDNMFATMLSGVRNENGEQKYKSVEDAFNGLKHAQEYIPQLKTQLSQKDQLIAATQAQIEELKAANASLLALTSNQAPQSTPAPQGLDEKQIAELVTRQLKQEQQHTLAEQNLNVVISTLQHAFGADAEKTFYGKASELGMSAQEINTLAAKSPKAVFNLLGVNGGVPKQNVAPTPGSINTSAFTPKQESFVGRNPKTALIGATSDDLISENRNARAMVDELHAQGLSVHDLTDPKVYAKYFRKI